MKNWYKILSVLLILYTIFWGLLGPVPRLDILNETIRNVYYHVPIWFSMLFMMSLSIWYAIRYLLSSNTVFETKSFNAAKVGFFFAIPGIITGCLWAKFTWGEPWSNDPKQTCAALTMLIYFALLVLRGAVPDYDRRAKIAAVYNIFAFALMIPLIWVIPSLTDSLHPGSGGNAGFNAYDLDNDLRKVFYPAVVGWILLGVWISTLFIRIKFLAQKDLLNENN